MARKTLIYTVDADGGRDQGKAFVLTELPARQAEWWAARVFLALAANNVDIPEDVTNLGMEGIAIIGLKALGKLNPKDTKPLLDEMMECVMVLPDPTKPMVIRTLVDDDIEEIKTILQLRKAIFGLHCDFFTIAAILT